MESTTLKTDMILLLMELILKMTQMSFVIMDSKFHKECMDGEDMEDLCFYGTPRMRLGLPMSQHTWLGMIGRN